uniref:Uncharacterized protein n=1 Tax=Mus spicilegus TaxID=10103 RepID=A0A8C6HW58_MUSSI
MEEHTVFQPLLFPPTSCLSVVSHCGTREWDLKGLPYWLEPHHDSQKQRRNGLCHFTPWRFEQLLARTILPSLAMFGSGHLCGDNSLCIVCLAFFFPVLQTLSLWHFDFVAQKFYVN